MFIAYHQFKSMGGTDKNGAMQYQMYQSVDGLIWVGKWNWNNLDRNIKNTSVLHQWALRQ